MSCTAAACTKAKPGSKERTLSFGSSVASYVSVKPKLFSHPARGGILHRKL